MKTPLITLLSALAVAAATPAYADNHDHEERHHADEQHHDDERPEHYEAEKMGSVKDALAKLEEKAEYLTPIFAKEEITVEDLEHTHEVTYTMEAAVDKLRATANDAQGDALDAVDEAVQALHYASEKREEAKAREWFAAYQESLKGLNNAY